MTTVKRVRLTRVNERQLVRRVLRQLGLPAIAEVDRFFAFFTSGDQLRYASQQQRRAYVAGDSRRWGLLTAIELGRWVQLAPRQFVGQVLSSSQLGQCLIDELRYLGQERVDVLLLDNQHRILLRQPVFQGTLNQCPVHPREIFQLAVLHEAAGLIIAHNHPSGSVTPSTEDLAFVRRVVQCGELMGIPLLDAFVVGATTYFSWREQGVLPLQQ
ncbi:JAB domain-containing protein [Levilactobacillus senmaizukei]|uniref:JAB domain-containing protein n=1 Tax=Levilactobacillus senmaizukei TaxID=431273 RepID=UPI000A6F27FA|nr:JAB domain-containing protein [Levilactobacillus senmaizukei]